MRKNSRLSSRLLHAILLLVVSSQCIGTLIRTTSRLFLESNHRRWYMGAFLAEDFESFYLGIGALAILAKSWPAWIVNMEWRTDGHDDSRSIDMSSRLHRQRGMGIFIEQDSHVLPSEVISEIFLGFHTRALVLLVLYVSSWIVLGIVARNACVH